MKFDYHIINPVPIEYLYLNIRPFIGSLVGGNKIRMDVIAVKDKFKFFFSLEDFRALEDKGIDFGVLVL